MGDHKLYQPSFYVKCLLTPFGALRTLPRQGVPRDYRPFRCLHVSGHKQAQIKLYPHLSTPLVSSSNHSSVARLLSSSKTKSGKLRMIWGSGDFERLLPSHLVMIPKERSEREATLEMEQLCKHQGLNCDF